MKNTQRPCEPTVAQAPNGRPASNPDAPRRVRSSIPGSSHGFLFSRLVLPEVCHLVVPLLNRGRRESRAPTAPAASRANEIEHTSLSHHRFSQNDPGFPRAKVLTAYSELFPVSGLCCHRRLAEGLPQGLAPASRRQNHTASPYAPAFSSGETSPDARASIASRAQRFVTIAKRPSDGCGTAHP